MGWVLKTRETKKYGIQYKIWTTVSDSWVTDGWCSRDEIIKFIFWSKFQDFVEKFLEESMTFPNGYTDKDTYIRLPVDHIKRDEWFSFIMSTYKKGGEKILSKKLYETLDQLGINLDISDENYQVGNVKNKSK